MIALAVLGVAPSIARADSSIVPDPVAQALFQDGRDLVEKGQWDAGCTKFEASMLLYPAASTLLNIARCYEHKQKWATAWSAYKRTLVLNKETLGDERRKAIEDMVNGRIAEIAPKVSKLKLVWRREVASATIRKDGESLPVAALGTELPVDAGEHEITAEAPDHIPFRARFEVKDGEVKIVTVDLRRVGEEGSGAGGSVPTWAWISGGLGLAALGVSAAFRADQMYVEGQLQALCHGDLLRGCPPQNQLDLTPYNEQKNRDFALFLGLGVAGAAALTAGVVGVVRSSVSSGSTGAASPPPVSFVVFPIFSHQYAASPFAGQPARSNFGSPFSRSELRSPAAPPSQAPSTTGGVAASVTITF